MSVLLQRWDEAASSEETNEICYKLARRFASRISDEAMRGSISAALSCPGLYSLCNYSVVYAGSNASVEDFANLRQILALFEKRSDIDIGVDRRRTAVNAFIKAEKDCQTTNDLFAQVRNGNACFYPRSRETELWLIAEHVARILGPCPKISDLRPRFGPGATTQIPKRMASARRKLSQPFACSEDLLPSISEVLAHFPMMTDERQTITSHEVTLTSNGHEEVIVGTVPVELHTGKLAFVPKNAKTDRTVVVEPWLNGVIQLALGDFMSERLVRSGMSTRDQSRNRDMAKLGSEDGSLATIDLSSASDTIATWLVRDILPDDWFELLNAARTSHLTVDGHTFRQEKFSSMGNGFTFPLETLIFWAIAQSCSEISSVYGDDIIVTSEAYDDTMSLLRFCGFTPNSSKSFGDGPFRESCGADYLKGIDIRPCYLKGSLTGMDLFRLHNHFVRSDDAEAAHLCLTHIHRSLRIWGPDGYGDGHLIGGITPLRAYKRDRGWSGSVFDSYVFVGARDFAITSGDHLLPLYLAYSSEKRKQSRVMRGSYIGHLREWAMDFEPLPSSSVTHDRGALGVSTPGVVDYKVVSIYTFTSN